MFDRVIALYRALGKPEVEDGVFEYVGKVSADVRSLLDEMQGLASQFGTLSFSEEDGGEVDVEFRLPASEHGAFYNNINDLIQHNSGIGKGVVPDNIYLIDEDWSPFDSCANSGFSKLVKVCDLIGWLGQLAVGVDKESSPYFDSLFFAVPSIDQSPPKSFVIKTKVSPEILSLNLRHVSLVEALVNPRNEGALHIEERKMIFQLSIADVLEQVPEGSDKFIPLLKGWDRLLSSYWKNLQSYVYGFSFEKIRLEVAKAEVEYSSKLSACLGDVAGKLLALPVSLVSLPLLVKSDTFFEFFVVSLGMISVTMVLLCLLVNQWLQVRRLRSSFNVVFDRFRDKLETYPKGLRNMLEKTLSQVDSQGKTLSATFVVFSVLSLIPTFAILYIYDEDKYGVLNAFLSFIGPVVCWVKESSAFLVM